MEAALVPVTQANKDVLANVYQFYDYDFSPFTNQDVNSNGQFEVNIDYYWEGDGRWNPFFIMVNGSIAGFLVVLFENMDVDPDPRHVIYDFMILQKYRRAGIGRQAALQAFGMYNAHWAVAQMDNNTPAIYFWRNVIQHFTGGRYTETYKAEWGKYIQTFSTKNNVKKEESCRS
ncbi:GNAT family N-acetyltransferase [Paenibacillus aquistagni]|uniref:Predicted acetyltransferase n=1 Tax=Paenibacillus aquistagni TaxID=1852522 RepID=A0A1X7K2L9_9BACL|nr:GNAT family N-acetyltransferase [Paenibacillus aquistagni]SMG34807.1 Predicted acetyltransferase [Paenibacillus aquistagni]